MKKYVLIVIVLFASLPLFAQPDKQIVIETRNTVLVLSVGSNQRVMQQYLGRKLPAQDYAQFKGGREVYLTAGMENQFEPAIRMVHADGNPSLELLYASQKTETNGNVSTTTIVLKDPVYPTEVTLHYTSFFNEDIIK